jgi:hypothetical protein
MNRIKLGILSLMALVFSAALVVHAQSSKELQSKMVKPRAVHDVKSLSAGVPETSPFTDSKQGYQMVTDVLDGFGGESESENYRIPVNSGGQPSPPGLSESANWGLNAGYVLASRVKRGDANADGALDLGDAIYILNYLFKSGPDPCPMEAGDASGDGIIDLGDAIYVLNYLFKGGPAPAC